MGATTAFQAGLESTTTLTSYAQEAAWATLPAVMFQAARVNSFSGKHTKTRQRPPEIRGDRQAAPAVTTQESASVNIVMPVYASASTYISPVEDFLSGCLGADWGTPTTITAVGGDISLNSSGALTSTTSGKFSALKVGQGVKLNGFTNAGNNIYAIVSSIVSGTSVVIFPLSSAALVTETPAGTAAMVTISNLRNGSTFKSFFLQERLDPGASKFFRYAGSYCNRLQLSLQLGQYAQLTADFMSQAESKGTTDASTGTVNPAPVTTDFDPIAGFAGVYFNGAAFGTGVDQLSIDLNNDGAAAQYVLGNALAAGMLQGTFTGSAKARAYFKDFSLYDQFRAETAGPFAFRMKDLAGASYLFHAPNARLMLSSGIPVDGPNKSLMQDFDVEFNPDPVSGITLSVDRFAVGA